MTPGPLRAKEMADPDQALRWHNAIRTATAELERRPKMMLWSAGPFAVSAAGQVGTFAIDHPPFKVGAVILASIQELQGDIGAYAPFASFARQTDGRVLVTYSLGNLYSSDAKFQLTLLLIEAPT